MWGPRTHTRIRERNSQGCEVRSDKERLREWKLEGGGVGKLVKRKAPGAAAHGRFPVVGGIFDSQTEDQAVEISALDPYGLRPRVVLSDGPHQGHATRGVENGIVRVALASTLETAVLKHDVQHCTCHSPQVRARQIMHVPQPTCV
jgi:hypothetical protein